MSAAKPLKQPKIIPRAEHHLSRKNIDPNALKVLYRLKSCGYEAYLVGGCVRDLLLGHQPKDFDIATDARPEEVKKIFRNCRLIGRRFRLAHIIFDRYHVIEVATFRAHHGSAQEENTASAEGLILRDNTYGSIEEDAERRDFTINALYYNIKDFSVLDFTNGFKDLHDRKLRIIGNAEERYQEDPVRMIRAIRIASKLDMKITRETARPIKTMLNLLYMVSPSRLFDETIKLFHTKHAARAFPMLRKYYLFKTLFPETNSILNSNKHYVHMFELAFIETDARLNIGKTVSPAYLYALLLWPVIETKIELLQAQDNLPPMMALTQAIRETLSQQNKITSIPKRLSAAMQDIWYLQLRLTKQQAKTVEICLRSRRFRAGYDLLVLRAQVTPDLKPIANWWTEFQEASEEEQTKLIESLYQK